MLWQWRWLEEDTVSQSSTLPTRCLTAQPTLSCQRAPPSLGVLAHFVLAS